MSDILIRIKRAVLAGHYTLSEKARVEMEADGLTELDVAESILSAVAVSKVLCSTSTQRKRSGERLYVIQSTNLSGLLIYTKGTLIVEAVSETYYFLIIIQEGPLRGQNHAHNYQVSYLWKQQD